MRPVPGSPICINRERASVHRLPAVGPPALDGRGQHEASVAEPVGPHFPHHEDDDEMRRLESNIILPKEAHRP